MKKVNRYVAYDERERKQGVVNERYVGLAYSKEHFEELAEQAGFDLSEHTVELRKKDVRNELRKPYSPYIKDLSTDEIYE